MSGTDYAKEGIVHIENLVKRYGSLVALDHLNLDIREEKSLVFWDQTVREKQRPSTAYLLF